MTGQRSLEAELKDIGLTRETASKEGKGSAEMKILGGGPMCHTVTQG